MRFKIMIFVKYGNIYGSQELGFLKESAFQEDSFKD